MEVFSDLFGQFGSKSKLRPYFPAPGEDKICPICLRNHQAAEFVYAIILGALDPFITGSREFRELLIQDGYATLLPFLWDSSDRPYHSIGRPINPHPILSAYPIPDRIIRWRNLGSFVIPARPPEKKVYVRRSTTDKTSAERRSRADAAGNSSHSRFRSAMTLVRRGDRT